MAFLVKRTMTSVYVSHGEHFSTFCSSYPEPNAFVTTTNKQSSNTSHFFRSFYCANIYLSSLFNRPGGNASSVAVIKLIPGVASTKSRFYLFYRVFLNKTWTPRCGSIWGSWTSGAAEDVLSLSRPSSVLKCLFNMWTWWSWLCRWHQSPVLGGLLLCWTRCLWRCCFSCVWVWMFLIRRHIVHLLSGGLSLGGTNLWGCLIAWSELRCYSPAKILRSFYSDT